MICILYETRSQTLAELSTLVSTMMSSNKNRTETCSQSLFVVFILFTLLLTPRHFYYRRSNFLVTLLSRQHKTIVLNMYQTNLKDKETSFIFSKVKHKLCTLQFGHQLLC